MLQFIPHAGPEEDVASATLAFFYAHVSGVYAGNHVSSEGVRDDDFLTFKQYAVDFSNFVPVVPIFLDVEWTLPPFIRPT